MTELAVRVVLKADGSGLVGQLKVASAELATFKAGAAEAGTGTAALGTAAGDAAAGVDAVGTAAGAAGSALAEVAGKAGQLGTTLATTGGRAAEAGTALAATAQATTAAGTAADVLARAETALAETLATGSSAGTAQVDVLAAITEKAADTSDALGAVGAATPTSTGTLDGIAAALGDVATSAIGAGAAVEKTGESGASLDGLAGAADKAGDALGEQGAAGAAKLTEQAMGKLGGVLGLVGGAVGGLVGALAGELLGALADSIVGLLDTSEKTKLAASGMDELARRNANTGTFIDQLTGKLIEQNRTLVQNAVLSRQAAIGANSTAIVAKRDQAFEAARGIRTLGSASTGSGNVPVFQQITDPAVQRAIERSGNSVVALDRNLRALAATRPDLADLARKVNDLASTAVLADRNSGDLRRELADLATASRGGAVATTTLIERQVAYANATGRVERAQLRLRDVRATAARADQEGGAALDAYRRDLGAATAELVAAQAAEGRATPARVRHTAATREGSAAARESAGAQRELGSTLATLERQFDPAAAAARRYAETMADIARLRDAGAIDQTTAYRFGLGAEQARDQATDAERLQNLSPLIRDAAAHPLTDYITTDFTDQIVTATTKGGEAFGRAASASIDGIGRALESVIGGGAGRKVGALFQAAAGRGGLFGQTARGGGGDFAAGLGDAFAPVRDVLGKLSDRVDGTFGEQGSLTRVVGKLAGYAAIGGLAGSVVGGSATGGAIGGAIGGKFAEKFLSTGLDTILKGAGEFAGPIGSVVGGIAGSVIGGLLKKTPSGSATITSVGQDATVTGNSAEVRGVASGLATSVQSGLSQIAQQLGGTLGSFAVSIGQRHGDYRVDTSGSGKTKVKAGAVDFNDDQAGAVSFAIRDAITDGAVQGLSAAVQKAIGSSADIDAALAEALKVQALETLLGGVQSAIGDEFKAFEATARERVRVATDYGFDLVKLEEVNGKARADLFDTVLKERVSGLQSFLDDVSFGSLFQGSASDQRKALLGQFDTAKASAEAGTDGAAEQLAAISRQLLDVSRTAYGTAGGEYAGDVATAKAAAENVIRLENERVKAAQDEARRLTTAAETTATLTNETNDLLAKNNALLTGLPAAIAARLPAGGVVSQYDTARMAAL